MSKLKRIAIVALGGAGILIAGCNDSSQNTDAGDCTFAYQAEDTAIKWTAYKLSEKIGVSGGFKEYQISGDKKSASLEEALIGIKFTINSTSVDSGVPERDKKIADQFFGTMQAAGKIQGSVKSAVDGKGEITISMNGQTKDLPVEYELSEDGSLSVKGILDIEEFGAYESLTALGKVCEVQHTGADKKNVLWPDVALEIKTKLKKECK